MVVVVVVKEGSGVVKGEFAVKEGKEKREEEEDEGGKRILYEWAYGLSLVVMGSRNIMEIFYLILRCLSRWIEVGT